MPCWTHSVTDSSSSSPVCNEEINDEGQIHEQLPSARVKRTNRRFLEGVEENSNENRF